MEITSVKVKKKNKEGSRMKGFATVYLDGGFAIHDIRIIEGDNGLFIAMPSKRKPNGEYKDIVHPINREVRTMFENAIFEEYNNTEEEATDEDEE